MINHMLDRYLAVDGDAVRRIAADVFTADNRAVLTYLPLAPTADEASAPTAMPADETEEEDEEEEAA